MLRSGFFGPFLLVMALACLPGCIGRMAVSSGVRKFNVNAVDSEWGREALFLGLYIIPVYPLCATVDLLIVNSIEFWNGRNPIDGETSVASQ